MRAREIRSYRKGRPKLGCYTCWYDCYEVEGERCPECNALVDRDRPWSRDGKWPIWVGFTVAACAGLVGVSGRVAIAIAETPTVWHHMYSMASFIAVYVGLMIGIQFACSRTRVTDHLIKRGLLTVACMVAPILLSMAIGF